MSERYVCPRCAGPLKENRRHIGLCLKCSKEVSSDPQPTKEQGYGD